MTKKYTRTLLFLSLFILILGFNGQPTAQGAVNIYASPVQAGCYLAHHDLCKIHVDPFTINLTPGQKLVYFQLVTNRIGTGEQRVIYDFRTDQSNPVPFSGSSYTPSKVAKDFAATCGQSYTVSLQGRDTGDATGYNLGITNQFACPKGTFYNNLPIVRR